MSSDQATSFSVVVPTEGRVACIARLLASLDAARRTYPGPTEVLIVDSSQNDAAREIEHLCARHDAVYCQGERSVRCKRNHGVERSQHPVILFLDSDVEVDPAIFHEHDRPYRDADDRLGGVYGLTRFVGRRTFLWKVIEQTPFLDVFSFAERYPFVQWAIGNNISYRRDVFEKVGRFEENFPFRLGGDDLELALRVTTAGYLIRTNPAAVTFHTRDTWNRWTALLERALRWGRMEYHLSRKHPWLFRRDLPRKGPLLLLLVIIGVFLALACRQPMLLLAVVAWCAAAGIMHVAWTWRGGQRRPWLYAALAKIPIIAYRWGRMFEHARHGRFDFLYRRMIFSVHHIESIWRDEIERQWISLLALWLVIAWLLWSGV